MVWLLGQRVQHARQQQGFTRPLAPWKGVGGMPVAERLWPKIYLHKHRIMVGCRAYSVLFEVDLLRCILPFLAFGRGFFRPIEVGQYAITSHREMGRHKNVVYTAGSFQRGVETVKRSVLCKAVLSHNVGIV